MSEKNKKKSEKMSGVPNRSKPAAAANWDYDLPTFMCVESSMPSPTRVTLATTVTTKNEEDDDGSPKPMEISGGAE